MAVKRDTRREGPEPRLVRVLMELAKFGPKMRPIERACKLGEAKAAYVEIYPESSVGGRLKADEPGGFAAFVAKREQTSKKGINWYVMIFTNLMPDSRARLLAAPRADKMTHLKALSELAPKAQARALDLLDTGRAASLREAVAMVAGKADRAPRLRPSQRRALADLPTEALVAELRARGLTVQGGRDG
ncbi:hypothetical protein EOW65_06440 [Sinirhodobacter ferrireducens]|uniref:Uncharacterized protein n=1 Tax=Paenirhodobacter ferrireducens TaxID=1215032 RepID=A0A443LN63_9RHOB|nr:hypothetical protein [Sinirhodobacter ferrireducens]RWR50590.1 hypothetical protein EOW65_06440 [Sinirhodobacter ferrireducens]